ncbi:MAG TPA: VIT domain-containing protein [Xanthobacteraceae bacterium]|nr:VIT domain-containing protein [Xanthobacteraceae bacterium]
MSTTQSEPTGARAARTSQQPGEWLIVFGVAYPAAVLVIELLWHICASAIFDPIPTYWHAVAVGLVPICNLVVWMNLRDGAPLGIRSLAFANGVGMAIAGFYALLFLPILPLALLGLLIGIGILPLAPLVAFLCALRLRFALQERDTGRTSYRSLLGGVAVGFAFLLVLDVPSAATRLGIQWAASSDSAERERGLTLLRTLGDDDLMLRLCYGAAARPTGLLSAFLVFGGNSIWLDERQRQAAASPAEAREIYYRVHGEPFNAKPAPFDEGKRSRFGDFQFDNDHGGTQVGGRLKGLHMVASRIDGSISGDDAVAYLEWTVEFRNSEWADREARLQVALPPGGVVSRATLWVNGEEREAAYGGRGEVRAAYQRVAVQQRRDPLLVTSKGADRVLAQAFPVPRNGGTIKFKLGITAPLELIDESKARLTLPAITDRNFSFAPDTSHSMWIESKQSLTASAPGMGSSRVDGRLFRISGSVSDRGLSQPRATIIVDRNANAGRVAARIGEGELVTQEVTRGTPVTATLMLVIDGSGRLADTAAKLIEALDAIPPGTKVGAVIAVEPMQRVALAPWSELQKRNIARALRATSFVGGQDNAPALVEAMQALEAEPHATLLWVHGPQPISFRDGTARLEQAVARLSRLPDVVLYSVEPGPNELLPDAPWGWAARSLPRAGSAESDLSSYFARALGQAPVPMIRRQQAQAADAAVKGSDHIARLWASDRVISLMRADPSGNRAAAVALAAQYRLVTPVSGAVVLETKQQYEESRLTPVSQATVPTVPEPHEWALLLIACAALSWWVWRRRHQFVAAA